MTPPDRALRPWPPSLSITATALHPPAGDWALDFMMAGPIGVGVVLADRGRREPRLGLGDLLGATPAGPGPRWWGKAIGATAATLTPVACAWTVLLGYLATQRGTGVIPAGIAAFAAVILPGMLFTAAMSLAIPLLTGARWEPRYGIETVIAAMARWSAAEHSPEVRAETRVSVRSRSGVFFPIRVDRSRSAHPPGR